MNTRSRAFAVGLVLSFLAFGQPLSATIKISGTISGDTTWTSADTINVIGNVDITSSGQLTIQAGAIILFDAGTGLYVDGRLTGDGESGDRIVFTSSADTPGGSPLAGSWYGVNFLTGSDGLLRNCDLRYATNCVYIYRSSPELDSCVIEGFLGAGINIDGYTSNPPIAPVIGGCVIGQNDPGLRGTGNGIFAQRKVDLTVSGCTIRNCRIGMEFYANISLAPHFQVSNCTISNHALHGIYTHAG